MNQVQRIEIDTRALKTSRFTAILNSVGIYAIAALFVILGIVLQLSGVISNFLTAKNFMNIIDATALLGIVAVGMSFITYSGHYADLSAPTTIALSGIVSVELLKYGFFPAILGGLIVGLIIGAINGIVVGKFKANPIIWTLAMSYVGMGIIRFVWVNKQIYPDVITDNVRSVMLFDNIYRYRFFNALSLPLVILLILTILGQFLLKRTAFGAQLKMTGSAKRTARFSGINVELMIALAFMISAFTTTIAGLAITSLSKVGAWYNGAGYDFRAVTAIVIGGMTLAGGRGSIVGVLGGTFVIGIMNNIMTLLGIGTFSQDMIRGAIF
ncbi:MAG: ABC transporter permease, partial [Sphaerochaetaceae bacterium]